MARGTLNRSGVNFTDPPSPSRIPSRIARDQVGFFANPQALIKIDISRSESVWSDRACVERMTCNG